MPEIQLFAGEPARRISDFAETALSNSRSAESANAHLVEAIRRLEDVVDDLLDRVEAIEDRRA